MAELKIECENIFPNWKVDEKSVVKNATKIFDYFMSCPEIRNNCALNEYEYNSVSFDFLFCDGSKTHEINKNYRNKDYPADIITFAVFADSPESERFVIDGDINLGEVIIALDKMIEGAKEKSIEKEEELAFFISHGILHLLGFDHQTQDDYNFVIEHQKQALERIEIHYDKV